MIEKLKLTKDGALESLLNASRALGNECSSLMNKPKLFGKLLFSTPGKLKRDRVTLPEGPTMLKPLDASSRS
ncbi:hypothetical protein [Acetilactobacillus jinshanensis]|uniref:Uncharacterized protein n=1 Tax=Acetilactobacillus jinshanensis TaxID=1720083 RepID=A0A4P6ZKN2_9LACO|nr:hypothetical protein [Acetilactobacillus jinshanensis]QBP18123.1 hypothetical protein ELX58_02970 [Acetilactobacillus jinshanensis]URL60985.1 hypothetical protein HGK75_03015 [uncultured bacterium]